MATKKGVWNLQQVRDKSLQSLWDYSSDAREVYTAGWNNGRLGLNDTTHRSSPTQIPGTTWGTSIGNGRMGSGVGETWSHIIRTDGTLWGMGAGTGKLGLNNNTEFSSPKQVGSDTTWRSLSTSWGQTIATKTDGTFWTWGEQGSGQGGHNNTTTYSSPRQVGSDTTWSEWVCNTTNQTINLKTDGTIWMMGSNTYGELGSNNRTTYSSPIQVGSDTTWGSPKDLSVSTVVKSDGTLWVWGANRYGQLGQNQGGVPHSGANSRSSPVQIPGNWNRASRRGYSRTLMGIKSDGTLWGVGYNNYGNLGQNNLTQYSSPVQVGSGTDWSNVNSDSYNVQAVKTDGTLWVWGSNAQGQLGVNNRTTYSSPVQVPGTWEFLGGINSQQSIMFKTL